MSASGQGKTRLAYDSGGRVRAMADPDRGLVQMQYDLADRRTDQITGAGPSRENSLAGGQDPDTARNPFNVNNKIHIRTQYNRNGQPIKLINGLSQATIHTYDHLGRLQKVTDPDGLTTVIKEFNKDGTPELIGDRQKRSFRFEYDAARRVISKSATNGSTQTFEYNGFNLPTKVSDSNGGGVVVQHEYDSLGRKLRDIQQLEHTTTYDYDASDMLTLKGYPSQMQLNLQRTVGGKIEKYLRKGELLCRLNYLGHHQHEKIFPVTRRGGAAGKTANFVKRSLYNANGLLSGIEHKLSLTDPAGENADPETEKISLFELGPIQYNLRRQIVEKTSIDRVDRKIVFTFDYDAANRLDYTMSVPVADDPRFAGSESRTFYDAGNADRRTVTTHTRADGEADQVRIANTDTNALNAPDVIRFRGTGSPISRNKVKYHPDGSIEEILFGIRTVPSRREPNIAGIKNLAYDSFGRLSEVRLGSSDDDAVLDWRISYLYDGMGRRVERRQKIVRNDTEKLVSDIQTRYIFCGSKCIEEYEKTEDDEKFQLKRRFIHGALNNEVMAVDVAEADIHVDLDNDGTLAGSQALAFLDDYDNTPVSLIRTSAKVDDVKQFILERYHTSPAGNTRVRVIDAAGNESFRDQSRVGHAVHHQGRWFHEVEDLYYNGDRFYDPQIGLFVSREPNGAWYDPVSFGNAYTFAGNNPVMNMDLQGNVAESYWDALSLALGFRSLVSDVKTGKWGWVALDIFGIAVDVIALALPFVPGGVGVVIRAHRAGEQALRVGTRAFNWERNVRLLQAADQAANVVQGNIQAYSDYREGNPFGSILNISMAFLGARGVTAKVHDAPGTRREWRRWFSDQGQARLIPKFGDIEGDFFHWGLPTFKLIFRDRNYRLSNLFCDQRGYDRVRRIYSESIGGYMDRGTELHHWLFPQASRISDWLRDRGFMNIGLNLFETPKALNNWISNDGIKMSIFATSVVAGTVTTAGTSNLIVRSVYDP